MKSVEGPGFQIRTLTAGVALQSLDDLGVIDDAMGFLSSARAAFESEGVAVQSLRIATQPLDHICREQGPGDALTLLQGLDRHAVDLGALLSVGPLLTQDLEDPDFPTWAADLATATRDLYFSVALCDPGSQLFYRSIRTAASTIRALSEAEFGGEANFRFAAAARVPASTPFFPVAYHGGSPALSIGLESAGLVNEAFRDSPGLETATQRLRATLEERLEPLDTLAQSVCRDWRRRWAGIDLSPAPSLGASIAGAIESLTQQPFGYPTTLTAAAAITRALDLVDLTSCGYSGLMLPLLEDRVLARRAVEGRFAVRDLLFYSSVCGTGLDVVPLAGDCELDDIAALLLDMAALAIRLGKPLAARLLPVPGKRSGEPVQFANPRLTASVALSAH